MGTVVINGVPLACSRNPPLQINGQKVWSPDININGQMITGVNINGYDYPPAPAGSVLYLPGLPGQGSTIWDRSDKANNGAITGATWTRLPSGLWVLSFDGNDFITVADADSLSFGNGTVDTAFTILLWAKMTDATGFRMIGKMSSTVREYLFQTTGDNLQIACFDADNLNSITTVASATVTSYEGKWVFFAGVYTGSGLNTGLSLYVNGAVVASTGSTTGTYVAMHNTAIDLTIGVANFATPSFATGSIALPRLVGSALTAAQLLNIYNQERSLFNV